MPRAVYTFAITLPFTLLLDYLWLGRLAKPFYLSELGPYVRRRGDELVPVYWAAALVYILIPLGAVLFALPRVNPENATLSSIGWGGLFGLVLYGVYDFTNMATLERWPVRMVWVDICWGCFLCAATTAFAFRVDQWLAR
ncbi:MAG: DUF2177 family protein [Deltaproteobacteria bacterium]|nr:DUF2177 family protein [Deltaproteobacteria bacterium]